ncbi:MAG: HAD family hydrolase [Clostridia bacterium]|nr:HAD family hydrolase [Clostridia bacterium]
MATYLFDFDGTLVDSMPVFVASMLQILEDTHTPYADDIVKTITPLGLVGTAQYYVSIGVPLTQEEIMERMKAAMLDAYFHHIPAKEQVIDTLRLLKERGDSLNILTASPHITLDACLKRLGIFDWFDHVWSCDDFATTKSDPAIYKAAAEQMGVPVDRVLFLDDNLNADRTAKAAGMKVCGVYDASSAEYAEQMKEQTDFYIEDFSQLPPIVW